MTWARLPSQAVRRTCLAGASRLSSPAIYPCRRAAHQQQQQQRLITVSASPPITNHRNGILHISQEVADAVATDKPVVALESTIYTHGAMGKDLAREHQDLIRSHGGIPAIIAIVDGMPKVGVTAEEIVRMIETEGTVKVSRRDVSYLVGMVRL